MAKAKFGSNKEVDGEWVPFTAVNEDWNEYRVGDYIIKIKLVVSEVFRAKDEKDGSGNPVFYVQSSNLVAIRKAD